MPRAFHPPIRLLLADDEEIYLRATAELLREDGFLVDTALDAAEASRLLEGQTYDVLISDIRMPGNLQFEFIRQIGRLAPDLPVIIVTAHPTVETATEAVNLPVVAYLTKPLPIEALTEQVLRHASVVRTRRAVGQYAERLSAWSENLQQLQGARLNPQGNPSRSLAQEVLGLSLSNMAGLLTDMSSLFQVALGEAPAALACVTGQCPRLNAYQQVLREGIQVLEATRSSFKSKELGTLRQKLEQQLGS
jgi:DNA-binding response OmpR family regulator